MMDRVRRIEMLVRAADAGSFAKAARLLQLDPSAVSHAIAELERELRVTLFYRTTRQVRLTEDGEELYRRGREILDKLAEVETSITRTSTRLNGTLRIGMGVPVSRHIIMPRLPEFMRRHPGLRLECLVLNEINDMHARGVDLLLRVGELPESSLIARKVAEFKFGVYAAPSYIASAGEPATPEDLLRHCCLVHKTIEFKPWDEWAFVRGAERKVVKVPHTLVTNDREGLLAAAVAGGGLMRIGMFDPALFTSGRLRKVLTEWVCPGGPKLFAVYRKAQRPSTNVAAFLEFLGEVITKFDPDHITSEPAEGFAEFARRIRSRSES